jgi:hypothetical protein
MLSYKAWMDGRTAVCHNHTAVRPSIQALYDNISHLFPLLLIGHVATHIVLIKGGASERCDFSQFGKCQFSYGIYNLLV